ncbi:caprin-2-like [Sparus aurata]|uniref:Cerebellin 20 n=1 Tax=Sparus aurata TaxID=8175 RepID=A0A671TIM2_SPAAU|nr:caprin-2-like [Sparus aurata]
MRAIVLLCLLHAAYGQTVEPDMFTQDYLWEPVDEPSQGPNADNACEVDRGSCSCCHSVREMHRLKTYFNASLNELDMLYSQTIQSFSKMKDGRTAFSVALFSSGNFKCFGPFTNNVNVVYEHVFLNLGDVYNTTTGIFTVPHSGVYSLALTVYSDAGSQGASLVVCANLQVNGIVVSGSTDSNTQDQEDSFTIAVALELNTGDEVAVSLPAGCFLCDDISHYNTFSAFLLYCNE